MFKKKSILVVVTAAVIALGYAIVSTNAFADSTVGTTPTVIVPAAPLAPAIPTPEPSGIPEPSGLQNSPLSTMPSTGENDADDSSANATNGDDNGEDQIDNATNGDDNGEDQSPAGVTAGTTLGTDASAIQNNDNQDSSNSND